jgi:hypothetical protein
MGRWGSGNLYKADLRMARLPSRASIVTFSTVTSLRVVSAEMLLGVLGVGVQEMAAFSEIREEFTSP